MTTIVISEQSSGWAVLRMAENVTHVGSAHTEEQAREIAFEEARKERRSCVVRYPKSGHAQFIATPRDYSSQFGE